MTDHPQTTLDPEVTTKLAKTLRAPEGGENGLIAIVGQLADEAARRSPKQVRAALVLFSAGPIKIDGDAETVTPSIHHIEIVLPQDYPIARDVVIRALQARNGQEPLDWEIQSMIDQAFHGGAWPAPEGHPDDPPAADTPADPTVFGGGEGDRAPGAYGRAGEVRDMFRPRDPEAQPPNPRTEGDEDEDPEGGQ